MWPVRSGPSAFLAPPALRPLWWWHVCCVAGTDPHYLSLSLFSLFSLPFLSHFLLCSLHGFCIVSPEVRTGRLPCLQPLFLLCVCCLPACPDPWHFLVWRASEGRVGDVLCRLSVAGSAVRLSSPCPAQVPVPRCHQPECLQRRPVWVGASLPRPASPPVSCAVWRSFAWATATSSTGTRRCSARGSGRPRRPAPPP